MISHVISCYFIASHILCYFILSSHLISSHLISPNLASPRLASSHLISSHAAFPAIERVENQWHQRLQKELSDCKGEYEYRIERIKQEYLEGQASRAESEARQRLNHADEKVLPPPQSCMTLYNPV